MQPPLLTPESPQEAAQTMHIPRCESWLLCLVTAMSQTDALILTPNLHIYTHSEKGTNSRYFVTQTQ